MRDISLQYLLADKFLEMNNKKEFSPQDGIILNRALFILANSYYFKETNKDMLLIENNETSFVVRTHSSRNNRHNAIYNCLFDEYGHNSIQTEESKYNDCEFLTDEEFEEYEKEIEGKRFPSEGIFNNGNVVLSKKDKEKYDILKSIIKNNSETPKDFFSAVAEHNLKPLINKLLTRNLDYLNNQALKYFESSTNEEQDTNISLIDKALLKNGNNIYSNFIAQNPEKSLERSRYLTKTLRNKYNLNEDDDILKKVSEQDPLFKDIIENFNDKKENATPLIIKYHNQLFQEYLNEANNKIFSQVADYTLDSILNKDVENFIDFIKKNSNIEFLFEKDPLKQNIHLRNSKEYNIKHIKFENIETILKEHQKVNIDFLSNHFIGEGMNISNPVKNDYDMKGSLFFFAYNQHEIIGALNLVEGDEYSGYDDDDFILTSIATSNRYRNLRIAESLFREVLDYCQAHQKNLIRTSPTRDGESKIKDKFSLIAKKEYPDLLVVGHEQRNPYCILKQTIKERNKIASQKDLKKIFNKYISTETNLENRVDLKTLNEIIDNELSLDTKNKRIKFKNPL